MKKKFITRRLRRSLRRICMAEIADFRELGESLPTTNGGDLIYVDRGKSILAVGHLDYVAWTDCAIQNNIVACGQLDDRLGVWMLMQLLPSMGFGDYDILLTDNEEMSDSTAQDFNLPDGKEYNWIFEFDRKGTDTVMYDYADEESKRMLDKYGFQHNWGSYTDICELEDLGCKAFNFGCGYHGAHSNESHADLDDTCYMALMFIQFAKEMANTHLPHTATMGFQRGNRWNMWNDYESSYKPGYGYGGGGMDNPWENYSDNAIHNSYKSKVDANCTVCQCCGRTTDIEWDYCAWCGDALTTYYEPVVPDSRELIRQDDRSKLSLAEAWAKKWAIE